MTTPSEAMRKADLTLTALKVSVLPDGTHFPSDITTLLNFAKWYAKHIHAQAGEMLGEREQRLVDAARILIETGHNGQLYGGPYNNLRDALAAYPPPEPRRAPNTTSNAQGEG